MESRQAVVYNDYIRKVDSFYDVDILDDDNNWDREAVEDEEIGEVIQCPFCKNVIEEEELRDGNLCPICFEQLTDRYIEEWRRYEVKY